MFNAPEVKLVAEKLHERFAGQPLTFVHINAQEAEHIFTLRGSKNGITKRDIIYKLVNKKLLSVTRVGFYLLFEFEDNTRILCKFKLGSSWHFMEDERWLSIKGPVYATFEFGKNGPQLGFTNNRKMPALQLFEHGDQILDIDHMGVDAFDGAITSEYLLDRFSKKPCNIMPAYAAIQNQKTIAGIGNAYASDIMWHAKVFPATRASCLTEQQCDSIAKAISFVMKTSYAQGGLESVSKFILPDFTRGHYRPTAFSFNGKSAKISCPTCKKRFKLFYQAKSFFYCSECQPIPRSADEIAT